MKDLLVKGSSLASCGFVLRPSSVFLVKTEVTPGTCHHDPGSGREKFLSKSKITALAWRRRRFGTTTSHRGREWGHIRITITQHIVCGHSTTSLARMTGLTASHRTTEILLTNKPLKSVNPAHTHVTTHNTVHTVHYLM